MLSSSLNLRQLLRVVTIHAVNADIMLMREERLLALDRPIAPRHGHSFANR